MTAAINAAFVQVRVARLLGWCIECGALPARIVRGIPCTFRGSCLGAGKQLLDCHTFHGEYLTRGKPGRTRPRQEQTQCASCPRKSVGRVSDGGMMSDTVCCLRPYP